MATWASFSSAGACGGHRSHGSIRATHPTVEPTLPLTLEMRLEEVERGAAGARARLVVVVTADRDVHDLELALPAPPAGASLDTLELPVRPLHLAPGESMTFNLPLRGPAHLDLPLRLTASFRTGDGQLLQLGQGVTLRAEPEQAGRSHAGAWEVMAVPLEAVHP